MTGSSLRVVFLGTSEFAVASLAALLSSGHAVVGVVTRPGRPRGRGNRTEPSPVAEAAARAGLPLLTPPSPRDASVAPFVRSSGADLGVVVAYGHVLPRDLLEGVRLGFVNVHASLLPRWRGASPVQAALLAGERETGVTTMHVVEELDAGDVILQERVPIEDADDAGTLTERLAGRGAHLLVRTLDALAQGAAPRSPQDAAAATACRKITTADERLDWSRSALEIRNRVRALSPRPGAYFPFGESRVRVLSVAVVRPFDSAGELRSPDPAHGGPPGTVREVEHALGPTVACGAGSVRLLRVHPAGGREIPASAWARGRRVAEGTRLG